ncbi:DUF4272 domain-containing protein [Piscinibacter sp. HJYY11]|uniref:DUF4272 domain-containing protein n=1 Tax=Piscinibacter sp. HJYY11 TaxID=2801333 RepID=UPI00191FBFEE|nr:DUF4272 domain-containing protein [Piscinibacter sp. HJYY11]MBL0726269.1 DUF4272 domain-containing protein [Piscinibacter sp. HJYY11]
MTPELRKSNSDQRLRQLAIAVNEHLPLIESEDETDLRSKDELLKRLIALWAVVGASMLRGQDFFRSYIKSQNVESWLSQEEQEFLFSESPSEQQYTRFSWRLEALFFLAWCGGLIERIDIPPTESSVDSILHLFPHKENETPMQLEAAIRLRSKEEILDWADLLYRLHWAVRDARLTGKPSPPNVLAGSVQEWHQAVNWMTNYEQEDDWDNVATDT